MSRWMKVAAVTLAAVVGLVPSFAQLSYAQALPEPVAVLPLGEDVPDEELLEVEGQLVEFWYWETVLILARLLAVGTITAWITYQATRDLLYSAQAGVAAMICGVILWR